MRIEQARESLPGDEESAGLLAALTTEAHDEQ